jgi:hypothetical protein
MKDIDKVGSFKAIRINNCKDAQENGLYPYGTYCIICDGNVTLYQHTTKRKITSILNK